ncbi:beta-ketoacyl synthase N-terminal-like domain-containing protein [Streptomyces sp. NPDC050610]|uniref:type I polyketide synthase n=1 Tax=Streptomyces sp. NPDC050610 TaxID=3157097 RepID=UPI003438FC32
MAALFPGARDLGGYWRNIEGGVDSITDVPAGRWDEEFYAPEGPRRADRVYCRRGGFVDEGIAYDLARLGVMPNSVPGTEPDQLIALDVADRSVEDAGGYGVLPADRERVGVVLGRGGYLTPGLARLDQRVRTAHQVVRTLSELLPELDEERLERVRSAFAGQLGPEQPESAIGLVPNLAASRIANRLDLRGPAYTVDAACASSLVAVDHAVRELGAGRCDVMLAGGVHHCHDITLWSVFSQLGALSRSQRCRPLHLAADGVLIGEGTGIVVLKRLADAERDGDRVYAVVSGTGVAGDGRSASLFNPDSGGQVRAVRQAWDAAGLDPRAADSVGLLEAHGTATPAGDSAELATLATVFGPEDDTGPAIAADRAVIGSVKSMIGHTMPAAGIAGLIKVALALHHGVLPPTLHCDTPHPALAHTRFRPLDHARPWHAPASGAPRRAGVNAFGFGGINAHVVLEEAGGGARPGGTSSRTRSGTGTATGSAPAPDTRTARTTRTIASPCAGHSAGTEPSARTEPAARTARTSITEPERVLRLAGASPEALAAMLSEDDSAVLAAGLDERARASGPCRLGIVDPTRRRLALARKAVAKGAPWRGRSDVWFSPRPLLGGADGRTAFVFPGLEAEFEPRVAELVERFGLDWSPGGAKVGDVGRHGAAVFQLGRVLDAALRRLGVVPDAVAGHSVGEWTAMACGGMHAPEEVDAFLADFDPDALRVPGAAFAMLGLPADRVRAELAGREDVVLSHDNAPNQSMVCGPHDAVTALVLRLRAQGVVGQVLPFRSGFHTPMLAPYLAPIRAAAEAYTLRPPSTPVWSATTAAPYPQDADEVRELFVRHLLEPVRFRLLISAMHDAGFRAFVQLGAGQLGSLIDDTLAGRDRLVVSAHAGSRDSLAQLRRVVTALWTDGAEPDVAPLLASNSPSSVSTAAPTRTDRTEPTHRPDRPGFRLDLGGALVSLPAHSRGLLTGLLAAPEGVAAERANAPDNGENGNGIGNGNTNGSNHPSPVTAETTLPRVSDAANGSPLDRLERVGAGLPMAAELSALLGDTAATAADLIAAARRGRARPRSPEPPQPRVPERRAPAEPTPVQEPVQEGKRPRTYDRTSAPALAPASLRIDVARMPYLLDHCFFRQRPGWPDAVDRWPVVPATTVVRHLMDIAERAMPGLRAVAVHQVRLLKWIEAIPATDVPVTVRQIAPGRVEVILAESSRAVVELAAEHPAPPAPWPVDPAAERVPAMRAEQLYSERWMFHGPRFQGVTELTAIGDRHVRGLITAPEAPGALLDNAGQLLGYWIMATLTERTTVLPVGMDRIRFHGPELRPGTRLMCAIRITEVTDSTLTADMQLLQEGRVWAELTGWTDRRFDTDPGIRAVDRFPGENTLSTLRPEGWAQVHERWPDLATRELIMRNMLGSAERAQYERLSPVRRRHWLLGRIAAKDAVRGLLWREGAGEIYPAEIAVRNDESGRPLMYGVHGRVVDGITVSLAHCAETAVAIARRGPCGIDVEEVADRPRSTVEAACCDAELEILDQVSVQGGAGSGALWFTRFWAAKEAVAKARGTGLRGRPADFRVVAADSDRLRVLAGGVPYTAQVRDTANPPRLPARSYVVAWTAADEQTEETGERDDH